MTIFFIIKTNFSQLRQFLSKLRHYRYKAVIIDSSFPKGVGDDRPITDTGRDVSLHMGRLEHDTRLSEMDGRLDEAGRSVVTLRLTNTRRKRHETNTIGSVSIGRETVDYTKDTVPRTEEPDETLESLSVSNRTNDSIGQLVVLCWPIQPTSIAVKGLNSRPWFI